MADTTRHPITSELIECEADWKDANGNWLPVEKINNTWQVQQPLQQESEGQ